jgi:hypothetical protein
MLRLILAVLLVLPIFAQPTQVATATTNTASGSTPATSGIDTTGAGLLLVHQLMTFPAGDGSFPGNPGFTDSKSSTWTCLTEYASGAPRKARLCYTCVTDGSKVGSGHTIQPTADTDDITYVFSAYSVVGNGIGCFVSGTDAGGSSGGGFSLAPGSVTPSATDDLVVTSYTENNAGNTISSFGTPNYFGGASGKAAAWIAAPNTSAINPTWNGFAVNQQAGNIAIFTVGTTPPAGARRRVIN